MQAPDEVEEIEIEFEKGRAVSINGKKMEPVELMVEANTIGGRNGVGLTMPWKTGLSGRKVAAFMKLRVWSCWEKLFSIYTRQYLINALQQ